MILQDSVFSLCSHIILMIIYSSSCLATDKQARTYTWLQSVVPLVLIIASEKCLVTLFNCPHAHCNSVGVNLLVLYNSSVYNHYCPAHSSPRNQDDNLGREWQFSTCIATRQSIEEKREVPPLYTT